MSGIHVMVGTAPGASWSSTRRDRRAPRAPAIPAVSPRYAAFPPLVRWAFYLFVASIPFEYPGRTIPVEITTITASLFLLAALIEARVCFAHWPAALWCFGAYLYAFLVSVAVSGAPYPAEATKSFVTLLMLVLVFWAASNLLRDDGIATRALLTLGIAAFVYAGLTLVGAVNLDETWVKESGRVTLFGQNANRACLILGSGALALVGLTYARDRKLFRPRFLVWPLLAVLVLAMLQTGSRGGLLGFAIGLWTFTVNGRTIGVKLRNSVGALFAVGLLAWAAWQSPIARGRFEKLDQMDLSGREEIFPKAGEMFLERPLLGWGPQRNKFELGDRLPLQSHLRRDTHNLVLEIMTSTGLLGGLPFLLGTGLCVWGAWKARRGNHGILPLAMTATLLAANMSSNYIAVKLSWLVLANAAAAGSLIAQRSPPGRRALNQEQQC
jgi:O-antigen ligase